MAHKASQGSTTNTRDSNAQRLGIKIFGGEMAKVGNVIVRQRGTGFHAGTGVSLGRDNTLFAAVTGRVAFNHRKVRGFDGQLHKRSFVSVKPEVSAKATKTAKTSTKKK